MQNFAKGGWVYLVRPSLKLRTPLILFFLFLIPFISLAQNGSQPTINSKLFGRVVDAVTKEPLPGAVVRIEGTTHVVSTDLQGKFNFITGQKFPYKLIITFIG